MEQKSSEFLQLRLPNELAESFSIFCQENGFTESGAVNLFIENTIKTNEISFSILHQMTKNGVMNSGETHKKRKSFRISTESRSVFSSICKEMGISMSSIIKLFMLYCVEHNEFPFSIS